MNQYSRDDCGTSFLDEIGTMSLVFLGKLLRALQEGVIERVGGSTSTAVDVCLVAATNEYLREEVKHGCFRDDLYYRLNVYHIHLPSLRKRRDDIPLLLLLNCSYPGNICELQHVVERGVISMNDGGLIDIAHIFRSEQIPAEALYLAFGRGAWRIVSQQQDGRRIFHVVLD